MIKDFREKYILRKGDTLVCGDHTYTIDGEPLGYGGSSILYPAKRSGSELNYAIKECFPFQEGRFARINGVVTPISNSTTEQEKPTLMESFQRFITAERILGQKIRNNSNRTIFICEELHADTITIGGTPYDGDGGVFALLERMDSKGSMLSDVLEECRKPEDYNYPLRRGGLPHIHTTSLIMEQLLRALQEVHECGFLYGDIHPGNLFLASSRLAEGNIGYASFFDFGCSRKLLNDGKTEVISDKKVFSTEGYIPPEIRSQNDGTLQLSKATDIYSAGRLMLLCLLTEGKDLEKGCFSRKKMLLGADAEKIGCFEKTLPLVNEILYKALSIRPEDRYQDATEMLEAILQLQKATEPPKYRLPKNMSAPDYFVEGSRDTIITTVKKSLMEQEYQPVFLWGYGGLGKTETAIKIAEEIKCEEGAYLVPFQRSLRETILNMPFTGYRYTPGRQMSSDEQLEDEYRERLNILKEEYEGALFIIDNFDHPDKTLDELRREAAYRDIIGLNLKLLFTTRYPVGRPEWEIKELDKKDLLSIMRHSIKSSFVADYVLCELIDTVGGHTLMVSLIAKTLEESWGDVTPTIILEALKNANLSEADFPEVVSDQNRAYKQKQIYAHMASLFHVAGLSETEKSVLTYTTLLPHTGMDLVLFKNCVEKEKQEVLKKLVSKGWLRRTSENLLTIHPVIRDVAREELRPEDATCKYFINKLMQQDNLGLMQMHQLTNVLMLALEQGLDIGKEEVSFILQSVVRLSDRWLSSLVSEENNDENYNKYVLFVEKCCDILSTPFKIFFGNGWISDAKFQEIDDRIKEMPQNFKFKVAEYEHQKAELDCQKAELNRQKAELQLRMMETLLEDAKFSGSKYVQHCISIVERNYRKEGILDTSVIYKMGKEGVESGIWDSYWLLGMCYLRGLDGTINQEKAQQYFSRYYEAKNKCNE